LATDSSYGAGTVVQTQAFVYQLTLTRRGDSGAQVAGLRVVTTSWVNRPAVAPKLPEFVKYPNAL